MVKDDSIFQIHIVKLAWQDNERDSLKQRRRTYSLMKSTLSLKNKNLFFVAQFVSEG